MKTVMTGGNFDPIHAGHIALLQESAKLGNMLIVVLSSDDQCVAKKGYCFMSWLERATILRAIKGVSLVIENNEPRGLTMAQRLIDFKPDIFTKGGDRTSDNMPQIELDICEKYGIKIVYGVGGEKIQSSSSLVKRMREVFGG